MVRAKVSEASPGGRSETTWG